MDNRQSKASAGYDRITNLAELPHQLGLMLSAARQNAEQLARMNDLLAPGGKAEGRGASIDTSGAVRSDPGLLEQINRVLDELQHTLSENSYQINRLDDTIAGPQKVYPLSSGTTNMGGSSERLSRS